MRISRPCYDKFHRCPAWVGGGMYGGVQRCDGGRLVNPYDGRLWWARLHRCTRCDVIVLPHFVRWFDPAWLRFVIRHKIETRRLERKYR